MGSFENACACACPRIGLTWSAAGRLTSLCLRVLAICLHLLRVHRSGMESLGRDKVVVTLCAVLCRRICATSGYLDMRCGRGFAGDDPQDLL